MFDINKIKLSPVETTAYWWVNRIKNKVREIAIQGTRNKQEAKFAKLFSSYTDVEWRKLYLILVSSIQEEIKKYPEGNLYDLQQFHQETSVGNHSFINKALFKLAKRIIPDIRLASNGSKDSVIYTTQTGAGVWYLSCGTMELPYSYNNSYIITGDEKLLYVQNLLKAIIVILSERAGGFHSTKVLRDGFCDEYQLFYAPNMEIEEIEKMFNFVFNELNANDLILGQSGQENFFSCIRDIDCAGLEPYMAEAEEFVKVILQKYRDEVGKAHILKKPEAN